MTKPRNESTTEARDFWRAIRETAEQLEHRRSLVGMTTATCPTCDGKRYAEPSRTDCDAHGSYYVPPVDCRACAGRGKVDVPCAPEVEAAAIRREIERLRERLREVEPALAERSVRVVLYRRLRALGASWNRPGIQVWECVRDLVDVYDGLCTLAEDEAEP